MLVLLRDQQPGLLEGVDEGRVQARRLHVLDHHGLQVFGVRQVREERVVRPRLPSVPGDERLAKLHQRLPHFPRHGRGPEDGARLVLDPLEALAPAAGFVLLAAAAGTGRVAGEFLARHGPVLLRRPIIPAAAQATFTKITPTRMAAVARLFATVRGSFSTATPRTTATAM